MTASTGCERKTESPSGPLVAVITWYPAASSSNCRISRLRTSSSTQSRSFCRWLTRLLRPFTHKEKRRLSTAMLLVQEACHYRPCSLNGLSELCYRGECTFLRETGVFSLVFSWQFPAFGYRG